MARPWEQQLASKRQNAITATMRPPVQQPASKLSTDLWKNYNVNLRHAFIGISGQFNSQAQAFYTAPIGAFGIPAGGQIAAPYTNFGIYTVADALLDINNPVLTSANGSYIQRQSQYINAIQLPKNTNTGAELRLQSARAKQEEIQEAVDALSQKAREAYGEDKKLPFASWVSKNYPKYDSLKNELQQSASATAAAMIEVYGPGAKELSRRITMLEKAQNPDDSHPGLNMPANIAAPQPERAESLLGYRPLYTLSGGYTDAVKQWITKNSSNPGSTQPTVIDISSSQFSNETWEQSGFSQKSIAVPSTWNFISARLSADPSSPAQTLSDESLTSGLEVKLITTVIKAYDVKPGAWDGDFTKLFSGKNISLTSGFKLDAACAVSTVVVGYNASYQVSLGAQAAQELQALYSKATSGGGSVSVFGVPIGAGISDFTKFTVAAADNGYPTVLGVVGRKLPKVPA